MYHNYNFVINNEINEKIKNHCRHYKISKNILINNIINLIMPVLDYYYYIYEDGNKFKYKKISATNKIRINININTYNKLKHIHNNMNTFSTAILIREMIKIFFKEIEKNEQLHLIKKIKRYKRRYTDKVLKSKKWKKESFITHMSEEIYCYLGFSSEYKLLEFNFST